MRHFLADSDGGMVVLLIFLGYLVAFVASILIPYWIIRLAVTHAIRATRIIEPKSPAPPAPTPKRFAGPLDEAGHHNITPR